MGSRGFLKVVIAILMFLTVLSVPVYADSGVSGFLDDLFDTGQNQTNSQLDTCEIDAISATNEECMALSDAGFEALKKSKELAFSLHHVAEALVQFISPMQIGGFIMAAISAILGLLFFMKVFGKFGRHAMEIILVLFGIGLLFLVLGDSIKF
jgi:hypothetical protein